MANGWTGSGLAPKDPLLASRTAAQAGASAPIQRMPTIIDQAQAPIQRMPTIIDQAPPTTFAGGLNIPTPGSNVGPVNALAQLPITADILRTTPQDLSDPTLGSRLFMNAPANSRQVLTQRSVYEQGNAPAFLAQEVARLNQEQALRRASQSELLNRIIMGASGQGGGDAYLWQEALRAAAVTPGANVSFGAPIQNPLIGTAYSNLAGAQAGRARAQTGLLNQAAIRQQQIADLQRRKAQLSTSALNMAGPGWQNPELQKINQQLIGLQSSGWTPATPRY